jgi:aminocarboxymuconate-semialdehyde decarboxylase
VIDLHTHVVPPAVPFLSRLADADPRWARLEPAGTTGDVIVAGKVFRTVSRVAWDLDERREQVAAGGGTGQLLSAMPELLAPWAPVADARDYAVAFNEWLADAVAGHGGFFTGLGVVPLRDPDVAAGLLAEVAAAGLLGVELPSTPPTAPLHAPAWAGFLAEAERLGLLVFVHAVGGSAVAGYPHPMAANGVLFPCGIGEAIGGLIACGVLARHPDLQVLVSHGGGALLTQLPRMAFLHDITPALHEITPEPPQAYARRLWFDPLLFDPALLTALAAVVGPERIVLGTDYPFMPTDPLAYLDGPAVPAGLAAAVRSANPQSLLDTVTDLVRRSTSP